MSLRTLSGANKMSFIHYTIVGHFDPATLNPSNIIPVHPLSNSAVERLLAVSDPKIAEHIEYREGYLQCCWAGDFPHTTGKLIHEFAYKLAESENCIGAELPLCLIEYPPDAVKIQQRLFENGQS